MSVCMYVYYFYVHSGLPILIVAIASGIANENYGSERGLVYNTYTYYTII